MALTKILSSRKLWGCWGKKKQYESQADNLRNQSFNIEQMNMTIQHWKDTVNAKTAMKKEFKNVNIKQSEDMHDELEDIVEDANEFQTDDLGAGRQFWNNLLINWHTKKERILRRMRPTKRSISNGTLSPNKVGKTGSGKDARQSVTAGLENVWISQGDGLHDRSSTYAVYVPCSAFDIRFVFSF